MKIESITLKSKRAHCCLHDLISDKNSTAPGGRGIRIGRPQQGYQFPGIQERALVAGVRIFHDSGQAPITLAVYSDDVGTRFSHKTLVRPSKSAAKGAMD